MKWTPIERPFPLPIHVKNALARIHDSGADVYICGGAVRDFVLGREVHDFDLATNATPDQLSQLFPESIEVGKSFGVVKVPFRMPSGESKIVEIATFRKDGEYKDHRRPQSVELGNVLEDAARRDFTINALFYDPKTHQILDLQSGIVDLKAGVIRAIGDPSKRFQEDALRLLRAVRFATQFGFKIEESTGAAITKHSRLLKSISMERVREELERMLLGPAPSRALELLSAHKLLGWVLAEVEALEGVTLPPPSDGAKDYWTHTRKMADVLLQTHPQRGAPLVWAALFLNIPRAASRLVTLGSKQTEESQIVIKRLCARLKLSRNDTDAVMTLISNHHRFRDVYRMREAKLLRWISEPLFEDALALHQADALAGDGNLAFFEFCSARLAEWRRAPRAMQLISGDDLVGLGFSPGPGFAAILEAVEDQALEGKLTSKDQALEFVIQNYGK